MKKPKKTCLSAGFSGGFLGLPTLISCNPKIRSRFISCNPKPCSLFISWYPKMQSCFVSGNPSFVVAPINPNNTLSNNIIITKINHLCILGSKKWSGSAFLGYEKWSGSMFLGHKKWSYSRFLGYNYYEKYIVFLFFLQGFRAL